MNLPTGRQDKKAHLNKIITRLRELNFGSDRVRAMLNIKKNRVYSAGKYRDVTHVHPRKQTRSIEKVMIDIERSLYEAVLEHKIPVTQAENLVGEVLNNCINPKGER